MNTVCSDSDRPVSLSSSASSASLQDSHSTFGSNGSGLGGCPMPYPHQNGSDISLDLTPVALLDCLGKAPGDSKHGGWSPSPGRAKDRRMKLSHLDRVVLEIVETEQAYVRDLRSIVEVRRKCSSRGLCEWLMRLPAGPPSPSVLCSDQWGGWVPREPPGKAKPEAAPWEPNRSPGSHCAILMTWFPSSQGVVLPPPKNPPSFKNYLQSTSFPQEILYNRGP